MLLVELSQFYIDNVLISLDFSIVFVEAACFELDIDISCFGI